jgi:CAAX protease family protein
VALPVKFDAFLDYGLWGGLVYLSAFTVKLVAMSVAITFFWARAGQATLLTIAMHGLSNDVARVGGLADGTTWQSSAVSELNLAFHSSSWCSGWSPTPTGAAGVTWPH